ncbi:MAG: DNA alkylation repair protein [Clostridia bacterium]|nr:DNA alkylation repair protein [Clostridia bacterium]
MTYSSFIEQLKSFSEPDFAQFQRRLIFTNYEILGVRTPTLRKLAKAWKGREEELFAFPNEYYEVVFIKLTAVSALPFEEFIMRVDYCVSLMDNWALCDSFKAKCIARRKDDFLPVLEVLFENGQAYYQRYVLVVLLAEFVEEKYLPLIRTYIHRADKQPYYVHMAVAWLVAEILVKHYETGVEILTKDALPVKTHNKAIQKAIESYRLTLEQKEFLRSLKIKEK